MTVSVVKEVEESEQSFKYAQMC